MLRTNLSTRPFYNERAVTAVLAIVAAIVVALSAYNALEIYGLTTRNRQLGEQVRTAEAKARELTVQARGIRQTLDATEVDAVRAAAREANDLIERRAFSWTELFNRFEATLPPDVRISAVQPQLDQEGRILVSVTTVARRIEDLDAFIGKLEETGAFRAILSRQEEVQEDGTLRSVIQGYYRDARPDASGDETGAGGEAPTSEAAGGATGAAPTPPVTGGPQ
ncbi:MAG: hypothetical protein AB7O67_18910 [Vicinamibacterales bacterium]